MGITEEAGLLLLAEIEKLNASIKKFFPDTHKKVWVGVKELKMFTIWTNPEQIRQARNKGCVTFKIDRTSNPNAKRESNTYLYDLNSIAPVFLVAKPA